MSRLVWRAVVIKPVWKKSSGLLLHLKCILTGKTPGQPALQCLKIVQIQKTFLSLITMQFIYEGTIILYVANLQFFLFPAGQIERYKNIRLLKPVLLLSGCFWVLLSIFSSSRGYKTLALHCLISTSSPSSTLPLLCSFQLSNAHITTFIISSSYLVERNKYFLAVNSACAGDLSTSHALLLTVSWCIDPPLVSQLPQNQCSEQH